MTDLTARQRELVRIYESMRGQSCTERDIPFVITALPHQIDKAIKRLEALQSLEAGKCTINEAVAISGLKRAAFYNFRIRWKNDDAITAALSLPRKKHQCLRKAPKYFEAREKAVRIERENPDTRPGKLAYVLTRESGIHYDTALRYLRKARERRTGTLQHPTRRVGPKLNQKVWDLAQITEEQNPHLALVRVAEQVKNEIGDELHIQTVYDYAKQARELRTGKPIEANG